MCLYRGVPVPVSKTIWRGKVGTPEKCACIAIRPVSSVPVSSIYCTGQESPINHFIVETCPTRNAFRASISFPIDWNLPSNRNRPYGPRLNSARTWTGIRTGNLSWNRGYVLTGIRTFVPLPVQRCGCSVLDAGGEIFQTARLSKSSRCTSHDYQQIISKEQARLRP